MINANILFKTLPKGYYSFRLTSDFVVPDGQPFFNCLSKYAFSGRAFSKRLYSIVTAKKCGNVAAFRWQLRLRLLQNSTKSSTDFTVLSTGNQCRDRSIISRVIGAGIDEVLWNKYANLLVKGAAL